MNNFAARGAEPIVIATQPRPRTSWWTVAEAGEAFTRELREAQARMACDEAFARRIERGGRTPRDRAVEITPEMVKELEADVEEARAHLERFRAVLPCPSCRRDVPRGEFHLCRAAGPPYAGLDDGPAIRGDRG